MDSLPNPKEKKILSPAPKHNFYIYCAAAAACIVVFVALFCVSFFKENRPIANSAAVLKEHHDAEDRTFDRIADYTMMDNEDIYASVADHLTHDDDETDFLFPFLCAFDIATNSSRRSEQQNFKVRSGRLRSSDGTICINSCRIKPGRSRQVFPALPRVTPQDAGIFHGEKHVSPYGYER